MEKYYLRLLPSCAQAYVWDIIKDCAQQASCDAYKSIMAVPHVYFTIADERINDIAITTGVLEGGFYQRASHGVQATNEGIYVYLAERANTVMFAEDIMAMGTEETPIVYPRDFDSQDDPAQLLVQVSTGPHPRNIYDIVNKMQIVGWFLGILCTCDSRPESKEILRCTYADVLALRPIFECMVISSFDGMGYIFLMKKTCFDEVFSGREYFGHGLEWRRRVLLPPE